MNVSEWAGDVALLSLGMLGVAFFLSLARLVRGPSLPDRVVALDLFSTVAVGFTSTFAVISGQLVYLDTAIVLALIAFLGTVAFARYTEKGSPPQ